MTHPNRTAPAGLSDFTVRQVTVDGATMTGHLASSGPAEILMPAIPGISPDFVRFGGWTRAAGFTVYFRAALRREPLTARRGLRRPIATGRMRESAPSAVLPRVVGRPRSVVTTHLVDQAGHLTIRSPRRDSHLPRRVPGAR